MRKLTFSTLRKLCAFSVILFLIYTLRDGVESQEMRAPNERVILNTADTEAEINFFKDDIDEDIVYSKLEEVKNLPEITPHKCRETKALHKGNICIKFAKTQPNNERLFAQFLTFVNPLQSKYDEFQVNPRSSC